MNDYENFLIKMNNNSTLKTMKLYGHKLRGPK